MDYQLLSSLFYKNQEQFKDVYEYRIKSPYTCQLPLSIKNNPSFVCVTPEITSKIEKIFILSNQLDDKLQQLPTVSNQKYFLDCLVEEIVLTNNIEGVHSTRKEVEDIIEDLPNDKMKRFKGLVQKYYHLINSADNKISLNSCKDIRELYNEMVFEEIDEQDKPDGDFFRKGPVSVMSSTQKEKHKGIAPPEKNVVSAMDKALSLLSLETVPTLIKIAVLHYYIGYIHPFYDGNGRLSRFISSYLISQILNPLIGLRLSYIIKNRIGEYYKAFEISNNPKNKGDLTYFVFTFLDFIQSTIIDMIEKVETGLQKLEHYEELIENKQICLKNNKFYQNLIYILVQINLFSESTVDIKTLSKILECSATTTSKAINKLIENGYPISISKEGRKNIYTIDLDQLDDVLENKNKG